MSDATGEIEALFFTLGLNDAGFTAGMKSASDASARLKTETGAATAPVGILENAMRSAGSAAESSSSSVFKFAEAATKVGAGFAALEVVRWASETLTLGARYETLGVVMGVVGANVGKTRNEMDALQVSLQKTGISMIESRTNLIRMAQAGIDLAQSTKLARIAQDAAVIGDLNSSQAFETLIHGIESGNTEVLRTIGINVNFQESYKKLAGELHTTEGALAEQQKAQARANAVMEQGASIAGSYEAAMGTAGKQINSAVRYLEDMKVKLSEAFQGSYTTGVFAYAKALQAVAANAGVISLALAALGLVGAAKFFGGLADRAGDYVTKQAQVITGTRQAIVAEAAYTVALAENAVAAQTAAAGNLKLAVAQADNAAAALEFAASLDAGTGATVHQTEAVAALRVANQALIAAQAEVVATEVAVTEATTAAAVALEAQSLAGRLAAGAMGRLEGAMAFFGGPIGIAITAIGAALLTVSHNASVAAEEINSLKRAEEGLPEGLARSRAAGQSNRADLIQLQLDDYASQRFVANRASKVAALEKERDAAKGLAAFYTLQADKSAAQSGHGATVSATPEKDAVASLAKVIQAGTASTAEIERARQKVVALRQEQTALLNTDTEASRTRRAQIASYIASLEKRDKADEKSGEKATAAAKKLSDAQKAALGGFDTAIAAQTPGTGDNLNVQLAKLTEAAVKAGVGAETIAKKTAELRAAAAEKIQGESDKLARDLTKQLVSETGSQSLQLREGLNDFNAGIAEKRLTGVAVNEGQVAQLRAAKEESIRLAEQAERLQVLYQGIDDDLRLGGNLLRDMTIVNTQLAQAEADKASAQARYNAGDKTAYRDIQNAQGRINSLLGEQNKLQDANKKHLDDINARQHTLVDTIASVSGGIANAANAAFGLASALGGANSTAAKLFGSIGQVSGGINAASGLAKTAGGFGNLLSSASGIASLAGPVGQVIGGAIQIGSSIVSAFGEDPKIKAARDQTNQAMSQLRDALLTLKDAYLQSVSSADIAKDTTLAKQAAALGANGTVNGRRVLADGEGGGAGRRGNLRDIASALGLNFDDGTLLQRMKELDRRYGTDLATFVTNQAPAGLLKALQTLPDALKSATGNLGAFSGKPADIIASVAYQFDLLGKTDAAEKVRETVKALEAAGKNLGEFKDQLDKLTDPNLSPAERQSILDSVAQRLGTGSNLNLGDFTGDQIRQLFSDASKAGTASAAKGTGGFNVDRSVTEVTGSRLAAILSTGNVFLEQISANTAGILVGIGGAPSPVIYAPTLPVSAMATSTSTIDININHTFNGGVAGLSAADVASIAQSTEDALQRALRDPRNITTISRGIDADNAWMQRSTGEMR